MDHEHIRGAVQSLKQRFLDHPEKAVGTDPFACARLTKSLSMTVEGPSGQHAETDMPKGIGGEASAPTPGWYVRAGIASCTATVIAMRAAELAVPLRHLEVLVESRSNDAGMMGIDDGIPAGPLEATLQVKIGADGASRETLMDIVNWGIAHSPMADGLTRAVPLKTAIDIV